MTYLQTVIFGDWTERTGDVTVYLIKQKLFFLLNCTI